jgi:hypothetical protein
MTILHKGLARRIALRTSAATAVVCLVSTGLLGTVSRPQAVVQEHVTDLSGEASNLSATGSVRQIDTGISTEMVGFDWPGRSPGTIEVRSFSAGSWSAWTALDADPTEGPDANSREYQQHLSAGPLWVGRAVRTIQFRITKGQPLGLRLHAIRTEMIGGSGLSSASASVAQPGVITRAQWGADESWRSHNGAACLIPSYADNVHFTVVHHTVQSNTYAPSDSAALVRGDYFFHVFINGWCDIGYNFLIDRYGQILEGRFGGMNRAVIGAHAGGFNTGSTGIALIGTFDTTFPTAAMYGSLRALITWKAAYHQFDPVGTVTVTTGDFPSARWPPGTIITIPTIIGHRDVDFTDCPGVLGYLTLPQLRNDVAVALRAQGPHLTDARLTCDWTGAGVSTPAIYGGGVFYIRETNTPGPPDLIIPFGDPGDQPVCGDWTGNGVETIGVFRRGAWYLRKSNTVGPADISFTFGNPGDRPIVGRWTGGADRPGVSRNGAWYLRNSLTTGGGEINFVYGNPGDLPVVGNWNGGVMDTPGVVRRGIWYLRNSNSSGVADISLAFGNPADVPLAGRWIGGKADTPGVSRGGIWFLRDSLSSGGADQTVLF